jgi:hypothetical protein
MLPFFNDLARSEWTLCNVVNQQGNTSSITGCTGPDPPVIEGPETGYTGGQYEFYVMAVDENGDRVSCMIDWGDGSQSGWSELAPSGSPFTMRHTYDEEGVYDIVAQARDEGGDDSGFSEPYAIEIINYPVDFDIWPGDCPNYFNTEYTGIYVTAIYAADGFDVMDIDVSSVRLSGPDGEGSVAPTVYYYMDKGGPFTKENDCSCLATSLDALVDLTAKFDFEQIQALIAPVVIGEEHMLTITGRLSNGILFEGRDCITVYGCEH